MNAVQTWESVFNREFNNFCPTFWPEDFPMFYFLKAFNYDKDKNKYKLKYKHRQHVSRD